jgi:transposase
MAPAAATAPGQIACVGLDVSRDEAVACCVLADGREPIRRWSVPNTPAGAAALAARLAALAAEHGVDEVRIGLEATSLYWWHLACALKAAPALGPFRPQVYALNPKLVHGLTRASAAAGKTDPLDASFIAERLRLGRLPAPFEVDVRDAPLQRLTRFRAHLAQALAREKTSFRSFLFRTFSAFRHAAPFGAPFGATSGAVLATFTTEEVAQPPLDDLVAFVERRGRGRFAAPRAVAATLQRAARDSDRLDRVLDEPITRILATTMATIKPLQAQLKAVDQTVAREVLALPPDRRTLQSVPGLGPVWTAGLAAEIGDVHRFPNDAALATYAGLVWHPHESGAFQAQDTPLAKAGNAYLRYYLVEAANRVRLHCAEYRAYSQATGPTPRPSWPSRPRPPRSGRSS